MRLFADQPPLSRLIDYFAIPFAFLPLATAERHAFLDTVKGVAATTLAGTRELDACVERPAAAGFPQAFMSGAQPPFDHIGDFLRGCEGVMLDIYRCPEKLVAATEKVLPVALQRALQDLLLARFPHAPVGPRTDPGPAKKLGVSVSAGSNCSLLRRHGLPPAPRRDGPEWVCGGLRGAEAEPAKVTREPQSVVRCPQDHPEQGSTSTPATTTSSEERAGFPDCEKRSP
jgi:hypothetical protein